MISVLVAVYNAESYLEQCLLSLARQTMTDIEVLCVDDCSTDGSLRILREYEQKDSRFRVFQTEKNSGQAVARNIALERATGEYITFLDADDWLAEDALEQIGQGFAENVDAVLFDVLEVSDIKTERYELKIGTESDGEEAARCSIAWDGIHGIYAARAEIFKKYPYDTTCRSYSDDISSTLQFLRCRNIRTSAARYFYRQHSESVTHKASVRRFDILRAKERLVELLRNENVPEDFHHLAATQVWLWLIDSCMYEYQHGEELSKEDRAYGVAELKRVWQTTDLTLVDKTLLRKFGYMHLGWWRLFRLQNWIYFTLRKLLKHKI